MVKESMVPKIPRPNK